MTEVAKFTTEIDQTNEKNKNCVHCQFCNSIMLKAQCASYVENEVKYDFYGNLKIPK